MKKRKKTRARRRSPIVEEVDQSRASDACRDVRRDARTRAVNAAPADAAAGGGRGPDDWDGPTHEAAAAEMAALAAASAEASGEFDAEAGVCRRRRRPGTLESVLESLLFASDRPLPVSDLKRLVGERDGGKVTAALEALRARREQEGSGIQVVEVAGGWHLRTHPENVAWVSRLIAGKPQRLTRAMLETLSIVAYRQPITRPEIDDMRGVDCGPVLKTLLDRGLVRMIGKKEEVGRPILYGTTPEFLRIFSLKDLRRAADAARVPRAGRGRDGEGRRRGAAVGATRPRKADADKPAAPPRRVASWIRRRTTSC